MPKKKVTYKPRTKTVVVDYNVWFKILGYQTMQAESDNKMTFSEIIDKGMHLLLEQEQAKVIKIEK